MSMFLIIGNGRSPSVQYMVRPDFVYGCRIYAVDWMHASVESVNVLPSTCLKHFALCCTIHGTL